jgi:hypothetical protein
VRELSNADQNAELKSNSPFTRSPAHAGTYDVLLAEANVQYNLLFDMDDINPEFPHTDVVLVIAPTTLLILQRAPIPAVPSMACRFGC